MTSALLLKSGSSARLAGSSGKMLHQLCEQGEGGTPQLLLQRTSPFLIFVSESARLGPPGMSAACGNEADINQKLPAVAIYVHAP